MLNEFNTTIFVAFIGAFGSLAVAFITSRRTEKKVKNVTSQMIEGFKSDRSAIGGFQSLIEAMERDQKRRNDQYELDRKVWMATENELRAKLGQVQRELEQSHREKLELLEQVRDMKEKIKELEVKVQNFIGRSK